LAETFAALTCMPRMRVSPATASAAITRLRAKTLVIAVTGGVLEIAVQRCINAGASSGSGAVYDAVHLAAAEAAQATALVTLNPADFERFRIETSPRIIVPPDDGGLLSP
jgi:predicted nucleic acid-binding protein